jgi:hypothetical protein
MDTHTFTVRVRFADLRSCRPGSSRPAEFFRTAALEDPGAAR